ncbi:MAG: inactive transglutaminase family protein [Thioalkalivibrionaceae bacterium]
MKRWHLPLLITLLIFAGSALFLHKWLNLGLALTPAAEVDVWNVEVRVRFQPTGSATEVRLALPERMPGFALLDETFIARGYGLQIRPGAIDRTAIWTTRAPRGEQVLYYRAAVYRHPERVAEPFPGPAVPFEWDAPFDTAASSLLTETRARSSNIESFATLLALALARPDSNENAQAFVRFDDTAAQRAETLIRLLSGARIPARAITTIDLGVEGGRRVTTDTWIEVHNDQRWIPIHPLTGQVGYPPTVLTWTDGARPIVVADRAQNLETTFSVSRGLHDALDAAMRVERDSPALRYSLLELPIGTQNTYRILLMVPLGALIIVFLRNFIGIKTFGTFMPVLIALSFRETELLAGVILFTLLVGLGLAVRFYLEHLRLLLVPRLAAVVIVVILLMLVVSIVSHHLGFDRALALSLFPMVILAMTIERMSIVWEEHGPADAIQQGVGSLLVAAAAYGLMVNRTLEHLFFVFPELLLIVLAFTLLLGRYTGYRLTELFRFAAFNRRSSFSPEADTPSKTSDQEPPR